MREAASGSCLLPDYFLLALLKHTAKVTMFRLNTKLQV